MVSVPFNLARLKAAVAEAFLSYRLSESAELTIRACSATNKWIADLEPWKMKDEKKQLRSACCRLLLEAVYVLAHFFAPFIPTAATAIFKKIGAPARLISDLSDNFVNLIAGVEVTTGSVLFEQLVVEKVGLAADAGASTAKSTASTAKSPAIVGKSTTPAKSTATAPNAGGPLEGSDEAELCKIDLRCGRIVECQRLPDSDSLYLLKVDIGEPNPRQVVSSLVKHYRQEELQGRKVVVYCNIKPSKMRGFESQAMVLAATTGKGTDGECCELLAPPAEAPEGSRPSCGGLEVGSLRDTASTKSISKVWSQVQPLLFTNGKGEATFGGATLKLGEGPIIASNLTSAPIF